MNNFSELELDEATDIFCPVCGHLIMGKDEGDTVDGVCCLLFEVYFEC